jgi:hypothetical protein
MITEGLKNIAEGFKKKFSRETVAATVGNPRNATRQMAQRKPAPTKAMGIKKPTVGKVGSVDTAFYTKVSAGQHPRLKKGDTLADIPAKLFNLIKRNQDDKRLFFEIYRDIDRPVEIRDEKIRHDEIIQALNARRKRTEELEKSTQESKQNYEKSKAEADKVIKEAKEKAAKSTETVPTPPADASKKPVGTTTVPAKPATPAGTTTVPTKPAGTPASSSTTPAVSTKPNTATKQETVTTKPPPSTKPVEPVAPATTPSTATQTTPSTSISTATKAGAALAAGGIGLSAAAKLSLKAEQGVKSSEDALQPNNDPKRVQKGEFSDPSIPKVGAATPDVSNSTSYGLFGINNIRSKGKDGKPIPGTSTMDAFIKDNPQLNLPDPGSNLEPEATKKFNQVWWQVSKQDPKGMLKSQLDFYKNKFENPAIESLNKAGISKEIANNPGVQVYMVDRRIAYGSALLDKATNYAKDAKTPEEFIRLISEFDDTHLRLKDGEGKNIGIYGDKTSDEKYKELEKGLHNRIKTRTASALEHVNDVGSNLNQSSIQNKDNKVGQSSTIIMDNTQTNMIGDGTKKTTQSFVQPTAPDLPMYQQLGK